jgi:hypothetical protein
MNYALWIGPGLLALIFLFTGGVELVLPLKVPAGQIPLPGLDHGGPIKYTGIKSGRSISKVPDLQWKSAG